MSGKIVDVGMRFNGDAKGAQDSIGQLRNGLVELKRDGDKVKLLDGESALAKELSSELAHLTDETKSLASASSRVAILESAIASADRYKVKLTEANAEVRKIQSTLSEAYNNDADKSLIKKLEKELTAAERAATSAGTALQGSTANIVRLNLAAGEAGITTGNLAAKKAELSAETERLAAAIEKQSAALKLEAEYQAYLAQEEIRVAEAEKRIASSAIFEHQRQAAIGAQKAAEYTTFWATALEQAEAAEKKAGRAAEQLNVSFNKLGIRSAREIEADLLEVNQALIKLAQRTDLAGNEFDRAFAAGKKRIAELNTELRGTPDEMGRVGQKANNLLGLFGALGLAFTGAELARQFIMVNAELENVERSFTAVTGSTAKASAEMDYARGVASRLGLEQISTARAYAGLMAATKGTAVEGAASRQVFESVARSMSLAGKSAAETEGALNALQQMASKGVISMEELRGQLGERLPGALNAAAEGLGITTAQLIKLTETGQLTAEELFPALAAGLNKLYADGGAETLTQEWNHFKNAVQDAYETIGDAGVVNGLKVAVEGMETAVVTTSTMLVALGKDIGTFFAALANGDIGLNGFSENARRAFAEIETEAQERLLKTARHNGVMAASLNEAGQAALKSAAHQSEAAGKAATSWTQLNVAFMTVKEAGEAATKQAVANVDAKKAEGDAALELATALGGEADKHLAKAAAAKVNAAATSALAERRREELAMASEHVAMLEKEAIANGGATEQQQKVIDALKKTSEARQLDLDKAAAQAAQSQVVAVQAGVEAAAYTAARGQLSQWSTQKEAQLSVDQAGIRLAIEKQRSIQQVARAMGDEVGATQALLNIKRLEIQLAELTAKAKTAEANATLMSVQAQYKELESKGLLTEAKKAELAASEAGARVKQIEAQIATETANGMRQLIQVTDYSAGSAGRAVEHYDKLAGSLRGVASAANQASDNMSILDDKAVTGRKGGFDLLGEAYRRGATVEEGQLMRDTLNELFNAKLAAIGKVANEGDYQQKLKIITNEALSESLAMARAQIANGNGPTKPASLSDLQNYELSKTNQPNTGHVIYTDTAIGNLQDAYRRAGQQAQKNISTVNINIGGKSKSIEVASASDANNLAGMLKLLESDAARAMP